MSTVNEGAGFCTHMIFVYFGENLGFFVEIYSQPFFVSPRLQFQGIFEVKATAGDTHLGGEEHARAARSERQAGGMRWERQTRFA